MIIKKLGDAIKNRDWGLVEEVYELFVGDSVDFEQSSSDSGDSDNKIPKTKPPRQRQSNVYKFENKFEDDLTLFENERVDKHPNLGTQPSKRTPRKSTITVKCFRCGKVEEVSPILAAGYSKNREMNTYRCDGCIKRS